jgi:hypothetical protein
VGEGKEGAKGVGGAGGDIACVLIPEIFRDLFAKALPPLLPAEGGHNPEMISVRTHIHTHTHTRARTHTHTHTRHLETSGKKTLGFVCASSEAAWEGRFTCKTQELWSGLFFVWKLAHHQKAQMGLIFFPLAPGSQCPPYLCTTPSQTPYLPPGAGISSFFLPRF